MKILVSACLLGEPCRYDGKSKPCDAVRALGKRHILIPICPEVMGGLPTPRVPAEIQPDGHVVNRDGADVSAHYEKGAQVALNLAHENGCTLAILKEKSPSCGNREVYDGSFSGTLIAGQGICAHLLEANGIRVIGESEIETTTILGN
jgi:uncharacterized protein YbbK (DUF523 family)